jgi:hypothetical protein
MSEDVAPVVLRIARVVLYIQGIATLLLVPFAALEIVSRIQHGQDVSSLSVLVIVLSIVTGILLLVCAVTIVSRQRSWVLPTAYVLEVLGVMIGFYNLLLVGQLTGIGQILIALALIILLSLHPVRDWLDADPPRR